MKKILVANRGEIALRIIRASKELGYLTVAIYSKIDFNSLHVQLADESICIGENHPSKSYLNMENIVGAALALNCDAIHPGYGFLSEDSFFSELVEKAGLVFIGPNYRVMKELGDKISAKKNAEALNIPVIPYLCESNFSELADKLGGEYFPFPVQLKISNSGGGKGIRKINSRDEFNDYLKNILDYQANNEENKNVFVEKIILNCKHIEIQLISDKYGNMICLGERDCSIQKNNQKLVEESPVTGQYKEIIRDLVDASKKLLNHTKYEGLGTVEFLVDSNLNFYFLEVNPRLQVEHTVTEMITGIDLVKEQIRIAFGSVLRYKQSDVIKSGHVIEVRINLSSNTKSTKIKDLVFPGGNGVRIDTHIYSGYDCPVYYDSLLAKLIVKGENREEAISKMNVALQQFIIRGIDTNIEDQYELIHFEKFIDNSYFTNILESVNKFKEIQNNE